jgi:hypothetical protein
LGLMSIKTLQFNVNKDSKHKYGIDAGL